MAFAHFTGAHAQSPTTTPFQPSVTDPRNANRFSAPLIRTREAIAREAAPAIPTGAGETGFDTTGAIAKKKKNKPNSTPKPGAPRLPPPPPPKPPGPPQAAAGHTLAQQIPAREPYSNAYRPPDAPPRRKLVPIGDPYEPLGIRAGTFLLRPSIDVTRAYDTNPGRTSTGQPSWYTVVEPALKARSQWSVHEAGADIRGTYSWFDTQPSLNRPMLDAKAFARFDASRDLAFNIEGRYFLSTDYPGSPNVPADVAKLPIFHTYGTTLGLTRRFNRFEIAAKATVDRTEYQDSQLTDGTTSSNRDRDFNAYGGTLRGSYEVFPGVRPFVEVGADTRKHDLQFDRNGFQRDSNALTPRAGTTFEISRILTGEISAGYLVRKYEDPNLEQLRGVVFDASLVYAMSGLTTVTLTGSSRADEIVVAGTSGVLRRDVGVQVDHAFRRWLIGTLRVGYGFDDYIGSIRADSRMSLGTAITYKLSREVALKGEYRYDQLRSNIEGVDYSANVFLVGLKLQR
ncbi:MAG: outer membrane beta-barrel protein [Xanthobacteraceae bacterium]|nr:outer membrane beta-barrel protein [Xanthobacteraceae bacterium]